MSQARGQGEIAPRRGWRSPFRPSFTAAGLIAAIGGLTLLAGCGSWTYNDPPMAGPDRTADFNDRSNARVVVIGHFENPRTTSRPDWEDVGAGISEALAKTVLNHGEFDAWIDPLLADSVQQLVKAPADMRQAFRNRVQQRTEELQRIRRTHRNVRYVIYGEVTDFAHTADVSEEAQRWGIFGKKREAIVAIQLNVFDVEAERVVGTDHVYGVAGAKKTPTEETYANIAFGSILFWSTPLGKAAEEAIEKSVAVLNRAVPASDEELRVAKLIGPRRILIDGVDRHRRLVPGKRYFIWLKPKRMPGEIGMGGAEAANDPSRNPYFRPLLDSAGFQLEAVVTTAHHSTAEALVKGLWPVDQYPTQLDEDGMVAVLDTVSAEDLDAWDRDLGSGELRYLKGAADTERQRERREAEEAQREREREAAAASASANGD